MNIKRKQVDYKKDHRKILVTMTKVMFKVVALVFQRVEGFVFDLPSCPSSFDQSDNILFINGGIGHPAVAVGGLFAVNHTVIKEINLIGIFMRIPLIVTTHSVGY